MGYGNVVMLRSGLLKRQLPTGTQRRREPEVDRNRAAREHRRLCLVRPSPSVAIYACVSKAAGTVVGIPQAGFPAHPAREARKVAQPAHEADRLRRGIVE
jgi:hypothetical protein